MSTPTNNSENVFVNLGLDVDSSSTLSVVCSAEAGDIHHTAFVHIHHAGWTEGRKGKIHVMEE